MKKFRPTFCLLIGLLIFVSLTVPSIASDSSETIMWINNLDFLPGDPSVITSFNSANSGVGGGLSGLIIESTTVGDQAEGGGK